MVIAGAVGQVRLLTVVLVDAGHPAATDTLSALAWSALAWELLNVVEVADEDCPGEVVVELEGLDEPPFSSQIEPTTTMATTTTMMPLRIKLRRLFDLATA